MKRLSTLCIYRMENAGSAGIQIILKSRTARWPGQGRGPAAWLLLSAPESESFAGSNLDVCCDETRRTGPHARNARILGTDQPQKEMRMSDKGLSISHTHPLPGRDASAYLESVFLPNAFT